MQLHTIKEAARQSGCTPESIRYYERSGIIPRPARSRSNYRVYTQRDVESLRIVRRMRDLGFTLEEAGSLVSLTIKNYEHSCQEVRNVTQDHLETIKQKLTHLALLHDRLEHLLTQCPCEGTVSDCGILRHLLDGDTSGEH